MANRNTLSIMKLDDFKSWLVAGGWHIQVPRGFYEVLRATKEGRKHPLIAYWRHDTNGGKKLVHFTVLDRDVGVVRAFLKKKYTEDAK